jgi:iron complex transport system ATP-binding protein
MLARMPTTPGTAPLLDCADLDVSVGGRLLVDGLRLTVRPGDFIALLGPNGVGKTLTLKTLAGLRPTARGSIRLRDDSLETLDRRSVARRLGLLLQEHADAFPATVLEIALLGRHSHRGFWDWNDAPGMTLARDALARMDLQGLEHRLAARLSGGERRRLALSTLLVQDPQLFLLDEPMNHLDPWHRFTVLQTFSELAASGRGVVASLHDPALATRYANRCLLLFGDGRWEFGAREDLLTEQRLESLYATPFRRFTAGDDEVLLPSPQA